MIVAMPPHAPPTIERAARRIAASNAVAEQFFAEHAHAIALTCQAMAVRFQQGGRLLVAGDDAQRSDVAHVVVEFLHPVIVGKRALPTIALPELSGSRAARALSTLGHDRDVLLVLSASAPSDDARQLLVTARRRRMMAIALLGTADATASAAIGTAASDEHVFVVRSSDPCIVQETHEVLYHVLWELVHVFLDHRVEPA